MLRRSLALISMSRLPTSRSFLLLDKLLSKAKESYLPLAKELLTLAKGVTPDSAGQERSHSHGRLKLRLSYSRAYIIIIMFLIDF